MVHTAPALVVGVDLGEVELIIVGLGRGRVVLPGGGEDLVLVGGAEVGRDLHPPDLEQVLHGPGVHPVQHHVLVGEVTQGVPEGKRVDWSCHCGSSSTKKGGEQYLVSLPVAQLS